MGTRTRHPESVRVPDSPAALEELERAIDRRAAEMQEVPSANRGRAADWLAVLRLAIGWIFLWSFLDKTFGFGYLTPSGDGWVDGGSPTERYLSGVDRGPLETQFQDIAGEAWADWLFMLGLAAIGVLVILGIGLRLAALAGTVMMALMWLAEWPPAKHTSTGEPTMSVDPVVDYHVIYALALIVVAATAAGDRWGLGRMWARVPVVRRHRSILT